MSTKLWKSVAGPVLLLGLSSPFLMNCEALGAVGGDCNELKTGDFANFKLEGVAPEIQAQFKGLLESTFTLDKLALEMETNLIASCGELGAALGMPETETKAEPAAGEGAKKVCGAVAAKISATLQANAGAKLAIELGEPKCSADLDALTACFAECGATVSPGEFAAACEGGEISGSCEGECSGSCSAEGGVQCTGACDGTCEGKCEGKDSTGKCDGKCEGKCSGGCKMEGSAKCEGNCSGGCSVEMKAPKCSGEFKPPSVSADCQMSCSAKTAASVTCDPPSIDIKVEGEANADIEGLVKGLTDVLPKIVKIQIGTGQRLVGQVKAVAEACAKLPDMAAGMAGMGALKAGVCATMAVEMITGVSASMSVNVEASASVSGSASGSAG